jgi:hypothetical protein
MFREDCMLPKVELCFGGFLTNAKDRRILLEAVLPHPAQYGDPSLRSG